MTEGKTSRLSRLKEFFFKGKGEAEEYKTGTVADNAYQIVADGKLKHRLESYELLLDLLNEPFTAPSLTDYVDNLQDMVNSIHFGVSQIAAPYARAGDSDAFAKMMYGWNCWYASATSKCERVRMFFTGENDNPTNKIVVNNLRLALLHHFFPRAFDVLAYCFKDLDVRGSSVTVIQNMIPMHKAVPWGYEEGLTPTTKPPG